MPLHVGVADELHRTRLDGQRVYHNDELIEAITLMQLVHGVGIDVCLSRTRLHLDVEVQCPVLWVNHLVIVRTHFFLIRNVADGEVQLRILIIGHRILEISSCRCHTRVAEHMGNALYRYLLMLQTLL